jgi:membrane protease YdiL (CAAX protease family)
MFHHPVTLRASAAAFFSLTDSGLNGWWRYTLGVALVLLVGMLGGGLVHWMVASLTLGSAREYLAANASLITLLLVVLIVHGFLHRRPWRALVTTRKTIAWGRVFQGAAVWGVIMLATVSLESVLYPGRYVWSFEFQSWFFFLLLALLLTPLQCAAEELFFRGYFLQAMGRIFRHPFVPAVLSSLLFTAPHLFNPEAVAHGLGILAVTYFTMGFLLALVVLRDAGLELAIGLHTANNFFLVMCFGYKDSPLPASAIFTSATYDPVFSLASVVVGGLIFYAWFFRRVKD